MLLMHIKTSVHMDAHSFLHYLGRALAKLHADKQKANMLCKCRALVEPAGKPPLRQRNALTRTIAIALNLLDNICCFAS